MAPMLRRLLLSVVVSSVVAFALASLSSALAAAQQAGSSQGEKQGIEVTGCLQKGVESGCFYLVAGDGKLWELSTKSAKLAEHVGHQVTVSGTRQHRTKADEAKMQPNEKQEAAGKAYGDLNVKKLTMVSDKCAT